MGLLDKLHRRHKSTEVNTAANAVATETPLENKVQNLTVYDSDTPQAEPIQFGGNLQFTPQFVEDNVVNDMTCVLNRFNVIFSRLKQEGIIDDDLSSPTSRLFFKAAESRYVMWLDMLVALGSNYGRSHLTTELLPPWDVAIIFYTHLTLPFAFLNDIHYSSRYASLAGIEFPWDKFSMGLQDDGCFINKDPDNAWHSYYPDVPYQAWGGSPFCGNELRFSQTQMLPVECPWCHQKTILAFDYRSEQPTVHLESRCCDDGDLLDHPRRSVKNLANDSRIFLADPSDAALKVFKRGGMYLNPVTGKSQTPDLVTALRNVSMDGVPFFATLQESGDTMTIPELSALLSNALALLPASDTELRTALTTIVQAYRTTTQPGLSENLAATVAITQDMALAVAGNFPAPGTPGSSEMCSHITLFKSRYMKFMQTATDPSYPFPVDVTLFPLDVLLIWRTHVLMPNSYHGWCQSRLGKLVDYPLARDTSAEAPIFEKHLLEKYGERLQPDLMYQLCVQALTPGLGEPTSPKQQQPSWRRWGASGGQGPTTTVEKNKSNWKSADGKSYRKEGSYSKTKTLWSRGNRPPGGMDREPVENDFSAAMDG